MPPVRTNRRERHRGQPRSHYETDICKILVGEADTVFKINVGLLRGTSFFVQHGQPRQTHRSRAPPTPRTPPQHHNGSGMFFDDSSDHTVDSDDDTTRTVHDLTDEDADYELRGRFFYSRDAFTIFVRHLNDALPHSPTNQEACWSLFKAYALAQQYNVDRLQNQVIDALQEFYRNTTIPITDLIYVVGHWGIDAKCLLVDYIVAQVGYEIATDWVKYRQENEEMAQLFSSNRPDIIEQLFQATMQHTRPPASADPAKHKRNWRLNIA